MGEGWLNVTRIDLDGFGTLKMVNIIGHLDQLISHY